MENMDHEQVKKVQEADEIEDHLDFLLEEVDEDKVPIEMALTEFRRWLKHWKILRKATRKLKKQGREERKTALASKEIVLDAIQSGLLEVVDHHGNVQLRHNLSSPVGQHEFLTYKRTPKLQAMRKMDGFDDNDNFGMLQGMVACLSGLAIAECKDMSGSDMDIVTAVFYFFN